jgi:hypothetical protein
MVKAVQDWDKLKYRHCFLEKPGDISVPEKKLLGQKSWAGGWPSHKWAETEDNGVLEGRRLPVLAKG